MNVKKLAIAVFAAIFVVITAISFLAYDKSASIGIVCEKDSYAEKYAKKHNIEYDTIADSQKNIGILNLEDFDYNNDGTLDSYNGNSDVIKSVMLKYAVLMRMHLTTLNSLRRFIFRSQLCSLSRQSSTV